MQKYALLFTQLLLTAFAFASKNVKVTLHSCSSISQEDVFTASDVFAHLCIAGNCATSTRIDDSVNPTWNEFWTFSLTDPDTQPLIINLYDYDSFTASEFLGGLTHPVAQLKAGIPETYTSVSFTNSPLGTGDCTFTLEALNYNTITAVRTVTDSLIPTSTHVETVTSDTTMTESGLTPAASLTQSITEAKATPSRGLSRTTKLSITQFDSSVSSLASASLSVTPAKTKETVSVTDSPRSPTVSPTSAETPTETEFSSATQGLTQSPLLSSTSGRTITLTPKLTEEFRTKTAAEVVNGAASSFQGNDTVGDSVRSLASSSFSSDPPPEGSMQSLPADPSSASSSSDQPTLRIEMHQIFDDSTEGHQSIWLIPPPNRRQDYQTLRMRVGIGSVPSPSYNVSLLCSPFSDGVSPRVLIDDTANCSISNATQKHTACSWESVLDLIAITFGFQVPKFYNKSLAVHCSAFTSSQRIPQSMNFSLKANPARTGLAASTTPVPPLRQFDSLLGSSGLEEFECLEPFVSGIIFWIMMMVYASIYARFTSRKISVIDENADDVEMDTRHQNPPAGTELKKDHDDCLDTHRKVPLFRSLLLNHFWIQILVPCHDQCAHAHVSIWFTMYSLLLLLTTGLARLTFSASTSNPWMYAIICGCVASFMTTVLRPIYSTLFWMWEEAYDEDERGPSIANRPVTVSGEDDGTKSKSILRHDFYGVTELNASAAHESEAETEASFRSRRGSTATSAHSSHSMGLKNTYRVNPMYTEGENGEQEPIAAFDFTLEEVDSTAVKGLMHHEEGETNDDEDLNLDLEDDVVEDVKNEEKVLTLDAVKLKPNEDLCLNQTLDLHETASNVVAQHGSDKTELGRRHTATFGRKTRSPHPVRKFGDEAPVPKEVKVFSPNPTNSASLSTPLGGTSAFKKAKENSIRRALTLRRLQVPDEIDIDDDDEDSAEGSGADSSASQALASQVSASPIGSTVSRNEHSRVVTPQLSPQGSRAASLRSSRHASPTPSSFLGSRPPSPTMFDRLPPRTRENEVKPEMEPKAIVRPFRKKGHTVAFILILVAFAGALVLHFFGKQSLDRASGELFWCDHFLLCFICTIGLDFIVLQPLCVGLTAVYRWMILDDAPGDQGGCHVFTPPSRSYVPENVSPPVGER